MLNNTLNNLSTPPPGQSRILLLHAVPLFFVFPYTVRLGAYIAPALSGGGGGGALSF